LLLATTRARPRARTPVVHVALDGGVRVPSATAVGLSRRRAHRYCGCAKASLEQRDQAPRLRPADCFALESSAHDPSGTMQGLDADRTCVIAVSSVRGRLPDLRSSGVTRHTATDLNGHSGTQTVEEDAASFRAFAGTQAGAAPAPTFRDERQVGRWPHAEQGLLRSAPWPIARTESGCHPAVEASTGTSQYSGSALSKRRQGRGVL
jgi:hypothetical protein